MDFPNRNLNTLFRKKCYQKIIKKIIKKLSENHQSKRKIISLHNNHKDISLLFLQSSDPPFPRPSASVREQKVARFTYASGVSP
jgi:hypothetical protein